MAERCRDGQRSPAHFRPNVGAQRNTAEHSIWQRTAGPRFYMCAGRSPCMRELLFKHFWLTARGWCRFFSVLSCFSLFVFLSKDDCSVRLKSLVFYTWHLDNGSGKMLTGSRPSRRPFSFLVFRHLIHAAARNDHLARGLWLLWICSSSGTLSTPTVNFLTTKFGGYTNGKFSQYEIWRLLSLEISADEQIALSNV